MAALDARKRRAREDHADFLLTLGDDDAAEVVDLAKKRGALTRADEVWTRGELNP